MNYFDQALTVVEAIENKGNVKATKEYWEGSPFDTIRTLAPATKGKFGEEVAMNWLMKSGFDIVAADSREADFCLTHSGLPKIPVEVKTSFLWINGNDPLYKFQQIRLDYDYDLILCLGIAYDSIKLFPFSKHDNGDGFKQYSVDDLLDRGILTKQHGNANYWFSIEENDSSIAWHSSGDVDEAIEIIYDVTLFPESQRVG